MTFEELVKIYEKAKKKYGDETYKHISEILSSAKAKHKKDFIGRDHEQSWRAFKGKNLEKLVQYIINSEVEALGLKTVNGNSLERTTEANLTDELAAVKRNLYIDYGKFGAHLPDVDIIVYEPATSKVIVVISIKVALRERIAQTGYWKIKLSQQASTKHVKVFFITPDEDGTLINKSFPKKGRAIVEVDTDGSYVMNESSLEESKRVKTFDKFFVDLVKLIKRPKS